MQPAPVALFVYNRPEHTRKTVESLRLNDLARHSDLFVFSDGPKNPGVTLAIQRVRQLVRDIQGFKSLTVVERNATSAWLNLLSTESRNCCAIIGASSCLRTTC